MANELPSPAEIGAASWHRDWHSYEDYQVIHATYMNTLINEGLVETDGLSFREYRDGRRLVRVNIEGRIRCKGGVTIEEDKWLEVRRTSSGYEVLGSSYSYHAWFEDTKYDILRYDSAHGIDKLHCHLFDKDGHQIRETEIPFGELPTLDGVIRQVLWIADHAKTQDVV